MLLFLKLFFCCRNEFELNKENGGIQLYSSLAHKDWHGQPVGMKGPTHICTHPNLYLCLKGTGFVGVKAGMGTGRRYNTGLDGGL